MLVQMSEVNAWPLYVPQEVMGATAVPNPTLVGGLKIGYKSR